MVDKIIEQCIDVFKEKPKVAQEGLGYLTAFDMISGQFGQSRDPHRMDKRLPSVMVKPKRCWG